MQASLPGPAGRANPLRAGGWTRREFLHRASRLGGAAVLGTMFALDLLARDPGGWRGLEPLPPGRRRRVAVLGGGLAGLCAAHELRRAGFEVTVLEARARVGGRCWTVRAGTEETELDGTTQACRFGPGTYFNPGPMRISHLHETTLGYCREFGIPLVPFLNYNQNAFYVRAGQPRRRVREVVTDLRGHTAELLAKVVRRAELDRPMTREDRDRLIDYLRREGRLDADLNYLRKGDNSEYPFHPDHTRGYKIGPDAPGGPAEPVEAVDLETLLKAGYGREEIAIHHLHQQDSMVAPSGGMDRIAHAFADRLGDAVIREAVVREVRRTADGVRIAFADGSRGGAVREIAADWCVCTLPPHLLARLPADFAPGTGAALKIPLAESAGKIGLQFRRRFWEQDEGIYGGRSLTDDPISQIYYPCEGFGGAGPAVLIGYYHFGDVQAEFDHPPAERERRALAQGARVHPQYPAEFENSFSVEWHRIRHSEYAFAWWHSEDDFVRMARALAPGDGPFVFAGDWNSRLCGWQAGAFASALQAVRTLHARASA